MDGDHNHVLPREVPKSIMERLAEPHSKERPRIPFAWMISYRASGALQNIGYCNHVCSLDLRSRFTF